MDTSPSELILLDGTVSSVIYRNEENGYTILRLEAPEAGEEVTVVGTMPGISPGEGLSVHGQWTRHSTYGEQFRAEIVERRMPVGEKALLEYLASGAVKGVGAAMARRLLDAFGEDVLTVIEEAPRRLTEVKGISPKRAETIHQSLCMQLSMRRLLDFLSAHGLSLSLAMPLYRRYGDLALTALRANPYLLTEEPLFTPFPAADKLARELGLEADDPLRLEAGLLYTLSHNLDNGHVFLPYAKLLTAAQRLLGTASSVLEDHLEGLTDRGTIVREEIAGQDACYLARLHYCETYVANALLEMEGEPLCPPEDLDALLDRIQREQGLTYAPLQVEAVKTAAQRQVMLLTGGPGTGKTTSLRGILSLFDHLQLRTALTAPTGRAAKRLSETCGAEASTIHRLLELTGAPSMDSGRNGNGSTGGETRLEGMHFERNEANPLDADVVIIDEVSMVDISLMHSLLKAVNVGTRLILVGDVNQLPSVGPGNVLRDMIQSGKFPVVMLTKIFRQAAQSDIIVNAHKINAGERVPLEKRSRDFLFIRRDNPAAIIKDMMVLLRDKLPGYVGAEIQEIQIMTPMRKGALGVEQLNRILQENFNPPAADKPEKEAGGTIFRTGDKVMQIKNNYQLAWEVRNRYGIPVDKGEGVFNGDMGVIRQVNAFSETLEVEFDEGRMVEYSFKQLEELELAYAITIHKSQGSEYPAVVIPIYSGPRMLMTRNLIYTAVTRAKKCVCLVGLPEMFQFMVENEMEQKRYSGLKDRILEIEP